MGMDLALSNAQSVSTSFKALLDESRLWFRISQLSGFCFATKTCLLFVLSVGCLATDTNIASMLLCFLLTGKSVATGCWLDQKATKSKLQTFRRLLPPSRSGNLRSMFLPSFILMSMFHQVHPQVQCNMSTLPLFLCLCSPSLRLLFVMVALAPYLLAFLFDALSPLICLPFPSSIQFPDFAVILLTLS
ncbi:hypothetical protein LINGRAHAP2_LOCUS14470 [Linum grandiflorum]